MGRNPCFAVFLVVLCFVNFENVSTFENSPGVKVLQYEFDTTVAVGIDQFNTSYRIFGGFTANRLSNNENSADPTYVIRLESLSHEINGEVKCNNVGILRDYEDNLRKPFLISYNNNNTFKSIEFLENESTQSKNFKKSIASFLRFESVREQDDVKGSLQETIHGTCQVRVTAGDNEFTQSYDPTSCTNFVHDVYGHIDNNKDFTNDIKEQMDASSVTEYTFTRNTNDIYVIHNEQKFIWYLNNDENSYKQQVSITNHILYNSEETKAIIDVDDSIFVDVHTSLILDRDVIESSILKLSERFDKFSHYLTMASLYVRQDHLEKYTPGSEHEQILNKIQLIMKEFTEQDFEYFDDFKFNNKMERQIFIQMLPYVGTNESLSYVKKLLMFKKVDDFDTKHLLVALPTYIREPTVESLKEFEFLINENKLSARVQKNGILSFSHLIGRVFKNTNASTKSYKDLLDKYLKDFNTAMKEALSIQDKLVYIMAFRNIEHTEAVPYLLAILREREIGVESNDRLRLAAIYALSQCMNESTYSPFESLIRILEDDTESKAIQIFAYDALVNNPNLSPRDFERIDEIMSRDEQLRNYHWYHMINLMGEGILPLEYIDYLKNVEVSKLSTKMSREIIVSLKTKQMFQAPHKLKQTIINNDDFPVALKLESLHKIGQKLITQYGIYVNSNLYKLKTTNDNSNNNSNDVNIYLDIWLAYSTSWICDVQSFEAPSDFNLIPFISDLKNYLSDYKKQHSFGYHKLESFSIPTSSGVPATFEHRIPTYLEAFSEIEFDETALTHIKSFKIVFKFWHHGYSGISIFNPAEQLFHSVRKSELMDANVNVNVSISFDVSKNRLKISLPLITPDYEFKQGLAGYISSSVLVTNKIDEFASKCHSKGGYKTLSSGISRPLQKIDTADFYDGLQVEKGVYDCDIGLSPFMQRLFINAGKIDTVLNSIVKCGFKYIIGPSKSKILEELELTAGLDFNTIEQAEKPEYYLPGLEYDVELSIAAKRRFDHSIVNIKGIEVTGRYSLGQAFSSSKIKIFKIFSPESSLLPCYSLISSRDCQYIHADIEVNTPIYTIDSRSRKILEDMQITNYVSSPFGKNKESLYTVNVTLSQNENLKNKCDIKGNPFYMYPHKSFPKYWECLLAMLNEDNLLNMDVEIEQNETPTHIIVRSDPIVGIFWRRYLLNLLTSDNDEVMFRKEYPISPLLKSNFIHNSMKKLGDDNIKIIHVLPGVIINDQNETIIADLSDYQIVHTNDEAKYKIYVKVVNSKYLAIKIHHEDHYLKLETDGTDNEIEQRTLLSTIKTYFDDELIRKPDNGETLYLPTEFQSNYNCLFGLTEVDGFILIQLKKYPLIIYYSPNSIHIIYNNDSRKNYNYQCNKEF